MEGAMALLSLRTAGSVLGRISPVLAARLARRLATRPVRAPQRAAPPGAEPITFRFGLAGLRWGDRGPRILAVHGWEGRASQFRGLGERLAARGYQLIAIDAPAHGRSAGAEANPIVFADALVEAAAELGPLHAVVGHSMGGAAALLAQARGLRVARSVAIAAPAALSDVLKRLSRGFGLPARAARHFFAQMQRHAGEPVETIDVTALEGVHGATLVVHDRDDPVIPFADGERIARTLQGELVETRGLGHRDVLREPSVLDRIAIFLAPRLT
jgi:pimeloyl-ACP methyl ester carboxylesterase